MADMNTSLPVRTQNNGDVVGRIVDGTTTTQFLGVDSSGRITIKLDDGSGNLVTSQTNGAQRALDVGINVAGVQIDPRQIRALTSADVVSVVQSTSPWVTSDLADGSVSGGTAGTKSMLSGLVFNTVAPTLTTGQQASLQGDAAGNLKVNIAAGSIDVGVVDKSSFTYGTSIFQPVGGVFQDTAPTLSSGTSGAARLTTNRAIHTNLRTSGGVEITAQVNGSQEALDVGINVAGVQVDPRQIRALTSADVVSVVQSTSPWVTKDQSDGSVTAGTAASFSQLSGGVFNTILPTLTTGQQVATQLDSSGRLIISPLTSSSVVTVSNLPTTVDTNYGTVGASTLRTAAQLGNATGAADFNAGATGAQTLRVAANQGAPNTAANAWPTALTLAGTLVSSTTPLPVTITSAVVGTSVNNYNTAAAIAAGSSSNHIYTITTGKTFSGKKIWASASGKLKIEVRISPDGSTYSTIFVGFNSTANPNITIDMDELVFLESGTGSTIEIIRTNLDLLAFDIYSTISGTETP